MVDCTKLTQAHLTVSSDGPDPVLAIIQGIPTTWDLVSIPQDFEDMCQTPSDSYKKCVLLDPSLGEISKTLDLVAHSFPPRNVLLLGNYPKDDIQQFNDTVNNFLVEDTFRNKWMNHLANTASGSGGGTLKALGIEKVRLLGCRTACSDAGRQTMVTLSNALHMPVFGTNDVLSRDDFTPGHFDETHAGKLISSDNVMSAPPCAPSLLPPNAPAVLGLSLGMTHAFSGKALEKLAARRTVLRPLTDSETHQIHDLTLPQGRSLPGLLTLPSWQYHILIDQSVPDQFHLLQILFDWHMVGVFSEKLVPHAVPTRPFANSACYLVRDPIALWKLMTGLSPTGASQPPPPVDPDPTPPDPSSRLS